MPLVVVLRQFQKQFFLTGDETMLKPMILKDIADITGLDVSTISRVSNSKYVQTWFGIYALKDFFTGSMQTTSGEEVSTGELKNMLKKDQMQHTHQMLVHGLLHAISHFHAPLRTNLS